MDLGTDIDKGVLLTAAAIIGAIIVVMFVVRVGQHFYHKRRAEIEHKRVDKTKRIFYPW